MTDTNEQKGQEPTTGDSGAGSQPQATDLIDRANAAAERLEKAKAEAEAAERRLGDIYAKAALAGRATAGTAVKSEDQLVDEKVRDFMRQRYGGR